MSRIGKKPIVVPAGVTVTVDGHKVTVKGPKGTLTKEFNKNLTIALEDGHVVVTRPDDSIEMRALHGTTRALIHNMVVGVSQGFSKTLELNGVGYRAQLQGKKLVMNLGYSHPVEVEAVDGVDFKLDGTTKVIVEGIDKEKVGAVAANIRSWRKPEPYKGKGIKYSDEVIRRKEGKTGK